MRITMALECHLQKQEKDVDPKLHPIDAFTLGVTRVTQEVNSKMQLSTSEAFISPFFVDFTLSACTNFRVVLLNIIFAPNLP